jgi:hypothetical protein
VKTLATILTIAALMICSGSLNAQTQKGTFMIGDLYRPGKALSYDYFNSSMNIGFGTQTYKSDDGEDSSPTKLLNFNLMPRVGYFFANNLLLGIDLTIASVRQTEDVYKYTISTLGAGPFVRYYIPLEKVMPFFELDGSFGRVKYKYTMDQNEDESKSSLNSIGGGVGVAFPLGRIVTFDMLVGYSHMVLKDKEDNDNNYRDIANSAGVKVGFTILLGPSVE